MAIEPDGLMLKTTITGEIPEYYQLSKIVNVSAVHQDFRRIGDVTQTTGSGLDDLTVQGIPTDSYGAIYQVKIAATGTPDTFQWRKKTGNVWAAYSTAANITAGAIAIENGITITFAATTGHTANDVWDFTLQEEGAINTGENYLWEEGFFVQVDFQSNPPLVFDIQQITNQAGWTADVAGLTQAVNDIQSWIN